MIYEDPMTREYALAILGGTPAKAARAIRCSVSAVTRWPDVLPRRIADRVEAAHNRLTELRNAEKQQQRLLERVQSRKTLRANDLPDDFGIPPAKRGRGRPRKHPKTELNDD